MAGFSRLLLAPMEGLLDWRLRDVLTRVGGIDRCVSEFVRVTDRVLPPRVFWRVVPELRQGSRTTAGVPVRLQLLGSDPACLADNAAQAVALGAEGIDLNFGCPAKTVNRHRGGAVLLDDPELLHAIVAAVRRAVPAGVPVSAKMRLGNRDADGMLDAARAIADGGAGELVVHGRTKAQGYRPPAFWDAIGRVREAVAVPVVANGEVWTADDARRCRAESGCDAIMLGRGQVADPGLARALRTPDAPALAWPEVRALFDRYAALVAGEPVAGEQVSGRRVDADVEPVSPRHRAGRLKQWLRLLALRHPAADHAHRALRTVGDARELVAALAAMDERAVPDEGRPGAGAAGPHAADAMAGTG